MIADWLILANFGKRCFERHVKTIDVVDVDVFSGNSLGDLGSMSGNPAVGVVFRKFCFCWLESKTNFQTNHHLLCNPVKSSGLLTFGI